MESLVGAVCLMKNKNGKIIEFILLYAIGLTLGHVLLVEVQPRYHYSILLGFVFAAGYGITNLIDRVENT